MRVVCTAGHVDHGKTSLVQALTGQQPDRLAEEQARGLTIEPGFAWTDLDGAGTVALVDLPGHERFVPNMLAGAGPVRAALLVVAADEGWMPQTEEHLSILRLLGIEAGVVALTRRDLVDEETLEVAGLLVADHLEGTPLADVEVVATSTVTGEGLDDLRAALARMVAAMPDPEDRGRPRLWVDRRFTVRGAGTVVTGTLTGGAVRLGDQMAVQPGGADVRVRGMQSLEADVDVAEPGWRVVVNLGGIDLDDVERGDAVVGGSWQPTTEVDAWCTPLDGALLGRRGAWRVHVGTASTPATLHPLTGTDLTVPGPVRITLDAPLPLVVGDRLVLREAGRGATVGGGMVLDPAPGPRPRGRMSRQQVIEAYEDLPDLREVAGRVALLLRRRDVLDVATASAMCGQDVGEAALPGVERVRGWLVDPQAWVTWSSLAVRAVQRTHQARPALSAVDLAEVRRMLRLADCPDEVMEPILGRIVEEGRLDRVPGGLVVPGHEPRLTVAQQAARTALLERLDEAGVAPPPLAEVAAAVEADEDLLAALLADGQLVGVAAGVALTATAVADAVATLRAHHPPTTPFTAAQAREVWGTTRKHALPLLELLDARGVTVRDGDLRRLT